MLAGVYGRVAMQIVGGLQGAVLPNQGFVRHKNPAADADALHLEIAVAVQTLANPDRDVYAFSNQVDRSVGDQELNAKQRVISEERWQGTHKSALDSEWTADANKALRV